MRRVAALIALVATVIAGDACAGSQASADPGILVLPATGGGRRAISNSYAAIATPVPVSADSAYEVLKRVYELLEIPVSQESPKDRSVGNQDLRVRRKIGGLNMQDVLDCGRKLESPNAETWDISMTLFSTAVASKDGGSNVFTQIQAAGHEPSQGDGRWIPCATMSALEEKIGNMVKAEIAK